MKSLSDLRKAGKTKDSKKNSISTSINNNNNNNNQETSIALRGANVALTYDIPTSKGKFIDCKVTIKCTGETFNLKNLPTFWTISDLKAHLEFVCGIPYNLQRLSYLDDG
jgi:hypothetical protein